MLLCDTLHLVGFKLYDRKRMEDDKKKENKHRLLGFESKTRPSAKYESDTFMNQDISPTLSVNKQLTESPKKIKKESKE
jgi:hypothetical protein